MRTTVRTMLVVAIVLDLAYWLVWFTHRNWIASETTHAYYDFENAFPLADFWLLVTLIGAQLTLSRRRPSALFWLVSTGAVGLYLGSMDLLYDLENSVFTSGVGGIVEAVIVLITWVFSITVLTWSWGHRGELLSGNQA